MNDGATSLNDCTDLDDRPVLIAGVTALAVGLVVLLGWTFDVALLKTIFPGWAPMKANAAIGFLLLGTFLVNYSSHHAIRRLISHFAAAILFVLCGATLLEYSFNWNLGIDELLFQDPMVETTRLYQPGRMSPIAAVGFLLVVGAIRLSSVQFSWARWTPQFCLFLPLLVSTRTLVGLLYGVPAFFQLGKWGPMALHTAATFEIVCVALLLSRRDFFLASLLEKSSIGSRTARRVIPWAIGAPLVLGLVCVLGEKAGIYQAQYGLTVFVVLIAVVLIGLQARPCRIMNQLDQRHKTAAEAAQSFRLASEIDALTAVLNRRGFLERAEHEIHQARTTGRCLACCVVDIDFFKKINDVHGHTVGDEVLRQFASLLTRSCRAGHLLGRLGGEEFCVLLPGMDEKQAMLFAERLRAEIIRHRFCINNVELNVTSSSGVAEMHASQSCIHSLMDSADAALLIAKRTGRNRVLTASSLDDAVLTDADRGPLGDARAHDIMLPAVAHVSYDAAIETAAQQLIELTIDSLPVVDQDGKLQGLVTEQDLVNAMLNPQAHSKQVGDCQHTSVAVFDETTPAEAIVSFFARTSIQRVVIVREGTPVGMISRRSILRWLLNEGLSKRSSTCDAQSQVALRRNDQTERTINDLTASVEHLASIWRTGQNDQLSPGLVGEATRIQHFVEALLTSARENTANVGLPHWVAVGATTIG